MQMWKLWASSVYIDLTAAIKISKGIDFIEDEPLKTNQPHRYRFNYMYFKCHMIESFRI